MNNNDNTTNPITDSIKNVFNSGSETLANTASNIKSTVNSSDYLNNNVLYIGLLLVVIICVIIAYVLYTIITTKLFLNIRQVADETKVPVLCTEKKKIPFKYDKTGNGERRSYTFWIYIHDMNKYATQYKNVFSIREDSKSVKLDSASPFIFLDKANNRMYVRFAPTKEDSNTKDLDYTNLVEGNLPLLMKTGIVIPYVPLQRWVHVAIVCNANSYKNYIYAYVDGDLVNTTSNGENDKYISNCTNTSSPPDTCKKDLTNIDLNVSGILSIGGVQNDFAEGPGFSGLVSKITSYNYELNQKDIYDDYYNGPVGGLLAKIGLGMFGIRSPIYKL